MSGARDRGPGDAAPRRPPDQDDPLEFCAASAAGDPAAMLDGIIEEYARMGWGRAEIRRLFDGPFFRATFGLKQLLGAAEIERRIDATLARCGVFRARVEGAGAAPCAPPRRTPR